MGLMWQIQEILSTGRMSKLEHLKNDDKVHERVLGFSLDLDIVMEDSNDQSKLTFEFQMDTGVGVMVTGLKRSLL